MLTFRNCPGWMIAVVAAVLAVGGCKAELGHEDNPLKIHFLPYRSEAARTAAGTLLDDLRKATGLAMRDFETERYIDAVVAFGDQRADFAFMNDMGYLLASEEYGAQAVLAVERDDGRKTFRGMIVAHKDSGITDLQALDGKKVAFVDVLSVSGYILPAMLLNSKGIKPADAQRAGTHEAVVRLVYDRKVDAGFTYHAGDSASPRDARSQVADALPDVFDKVVVVATTQEIPFEPLVVGKHVPQPLRDKVVQALEAYIRTQAGRGVFEDLCEITGLRRVSDAEYAPIREALHGLGMRLDDLVPGGGILKLKRKLEQETIPPMGN